MLFHSFHKMPITIFVEASVVPFLLKQNNQSIVKITSYFCVRCKNRGHLFSGIEPKHVHAELICDRHEIDVTGPLRAQVQLMRRWTSVVYIATEWWHKSILRVAAFHPKAAVTLNELLWTCSLSNRKWAVPSKHFFSNSRDVPVRKKNACQKFVCCFLVSHKTYVKPQFVCTLRRSTHSCLSFLPTRLSVLVCTCVKIFLHLKITNVQLDLRNTNCSQTYFFYCSLEFTSAQKLISTLDSYVK